MGKPLNPRERKRRDDALKKDMRAHQDRLSTAKMPTSQKFRDNMDDIDWGKKKGWKK